MNVDRKIDELYECEIVSLRSIATITELLKEKGILTDSEIRECYARIEKEQEEEHDNKGKGEK